MSDTIQVIKPCPRCVADEKREHLQRDCGWRFKVEGHEGATVIELTSEQRNRFFNKRDQRGTEDWKRRWVSEWEDA